MKQELTRLKQSDLQESYQRQQRQKVMRYKKVIKENNDFKEKMEIWKLQEILVKKAQQELQRKQKLENKHLDQSMLVVSQAMLGSTVIAMCLLFERRRSRCSKAFRSRSRARTCSKEC